MIGMRGGKNKMIDPGLIVVWIIKSFIVLIIFLFVLGIALFSIIMFLAIIADLLGLFFYELLKGFKKK